jgi:2-oxo-hept-3-ene-1,7-dioate hydratase
LFNFAFKNEVIMDKNDILDAVEALDMAEKTRFQTGLLSQKHPHITLEEAYAIQNAWIEMKYAQGRTRIGRKIGLTSRAMQQALNITEPDSGVLLDDMLFTNEIPTSRFISTRIEAELAFILKKPLNGTNNTIFDVLNATDYITPALELLDTRIVRQDPTTKATRKIFDTVADNAANAGIILGGTPFKPESLDPRWVGACVYKNASLEETGLAAGVLNHPANGIVWLANRLGAQGITLEVGEIMLAGSFIRPIETQKGDTITADYGALGTIVVHFT